MRISDGEFGSVELASIEYHYNKNRLHMVQLYPHGGRTDWAILSYLLKTRFGDPFEAEEILNGILFLTRIYDKDPFTHVRFSFEIYGTHVICILRSKKMLSIIVDEEIRAKSKLKKDGF